LQFHPCQLSTKAVVSAHAEGHARRWRAQQIETVGFGEGRRIPVGYCPHRQHGPARRDRDPAEAERRLNSADDAWCHLSTPMAPSMSCEYTNY
jgi:hypothetical protein